MSRDQFDLVVIGAGIVGLASARAAAERWPDARMCVLERHGAVAAGQSGHNSGVIHSGIYYVPGSLKARLCRSGRTLLQEFCRAQGIAHRIDGKLIVATREEEIPRLRGLHERGLANGLQGLRWLDGETVRAVEPAARGVAALHVPEAGVVDYTEVCSALARDLADRRIEVRPFEPLRSATAEAGGLRLSTGRGRLWTRTLLSCAGLYADVVARCCGVSLDLRVIPFRGEYWRLSGESAESVRGLIYPVPDPSLPFLGVHLTRDVHGQVDAGPNAVLALSREGYSRGDVDLAHLAGTLGFAGFHRMIRRHGRTGLLEMWRSTHRGRLVRDLQRLVPAIRADELSKAPAGVRAQVVRRDGSLVDDFEFARSQRALHVINAPSPAATASFAIAETIVDEIAAMMEV